MKITELHQNVINFLIQNSSIIGVNPENIKKGKTGEYATAFPSILTHILPNNDNVVYNNFDIDKSVSLQVATFAEDEEELYSISEMANTLLQVEFRPYKFEFLSQEIYDDDCFIVYQFNLHL